MRPFTNSLDTETQYLVALGSAVASSCVPCLERITEKARAEEIDEKKMRAAAIIGQFVKDQPADNVKKTADRLLGTHLQVAAAQGACSTKLEQTSAAENNHPSDNACGCS